MAATAFDPQEVCPTPPAEPLLEPLPDLALLDRARCTGQTVIGQVGQIINRAHREGVNGVDQAVCFAMDRAVRLPVDIRVIGLSKTVFEALGVGRPSAFTV